MSFKKALNLIREKSNNEQELGFAFEKICKIFFENDATQTQEYSQVWHYKDWAKQNPGYSETDIGIDLVAKLRNDEGYCAIQCKCYQSEYSISKSDIDSFVSASSTPDFTRLVLIDTSTEPLGKNSQSVFDNLSAEYVRIQQLGQATAHIMQTQLRTILSARPTQMTAQNQSCTTVQRQANTG